MCLEYCRVVGEFTVWTAASRGQLSSRKDLSEKMDRFAQTTEFICSYLIITKNVIASDALVEESKAHVVVLFGLRLGLLLLLLISSGSTGSSSGSGCRSGS